MIIHQTTRAPQAPNQPSHTVNTRAPVTTRPSVPAVAVEEDDDFGFIEDSGNAAHTRESVTPPPPPGYFAPAPPAPEAPRGRPGLPDEPPHRSLIDVLLRGNLGSPPPRRRRRDSSEATVCGRFDPITKVFHERKNSSSSSSMSPVRRGSPSSQPMQRTPRPDGKAE